MAPAGSPAARPHVRTLRRVLAALAELLVIALLLWVLPAVAGADTPRFLLPLQAPVSVVRGFDPPVHRWQPGHRGVDLAAPAGTAVRAAGAGTVQFAGDVAGRPVVSIRHSGDLVTTYEPVRATIPRGQSVRRGEVIGLVVAGHPGCPAEACLHWGARRGRGRSAEYLNPLGLVGAIRVRLKPVGTVVALTRVGVPADAPLAGVRR
ncbi:M23 family metallopeptidase [Gordonia insulae]|nr:M23 family metallopeptidase [Gordonia insulae]